VGDLHIYPTNIRKTFQALAIEAQQLAQSGATLILLGGDHSISFALFSGVMLANRERESSDRIGYVQIDHHFDFGSNSAIHGPIYHGSNARRISEQPGMLPSRMAFIGAGSVTRKDQFEFLVNSGFHVITAAQIRERGAQESLSGLVRDFNRDCDRVYLSIDIDVLNAADAPGTGNVTYGGLDVATLMDVISQLRRLRLVAVDLVEVAPRYDPSGRTAQVAAQIIFETVYRNTSSE
jgi:arginase family enzyme